MEKVIDFCEITGESVKEYIGERYYIATGDIIDNKIVSFEKVTYNNKPSRANQNVKVGDVLFAKMKDTKKVIIIDEKNVNNIYSTGFFVITPKNNVQSKYLYWLFNSNKFNEQKNKKCKGATQKALNNDGFSKIFIKEFPTIDEQHHIIYELDKIQEIIDMKIKQIEDIDNLIKSQFVEMFGDPYLNQYNWRMGIVRELVDDVRYGTSKPSNEGGKYKYLRMNNITYNGKLDISDIKYIDIPDSEIEKCSTKNGDVLFNRTNSRDLVGKTCVYDLDEKMVIAGFVIRVRVNELANPYFLSEYLNTKYMKKNLYNMCKNASGQSNINAQELQNIKIYIPPIELQNKFAEFVKLIDKQKFEIQKSLKEMQKLQESLMNKYFGD